MKLTAIITTLLYTSATSSYVKADNNNNNIQSPEALEVLADQFKEVAALLFATAHEADILSKYGDQFTPAEIKDELQRILDSTTVAEMLGDKAGDEAAVLFDSITSMDNASPEQMLFSHGGSKGIINIVGNSGNSKPDRYESGVIPYASMATEEFATWRSSTRNALSNAGRSTSQALGNAHHSTSQALGNAHHSTSQALGNAHYSTSHALNKAHVGIPSHSIQRKLFRGRNPVQAATSVTTSAVSSSVATAHNAAAQSCLVAAEALENASTVTADALNTGTAATHAAAETAIYAAENAAELAEASVGLAADLTANVFSSLRW